MDHKQRKEDMIRLRHEFGFTLQEIGEIYGISRERVRQIIGNTGCIKTKRERKKCFEALINNLDKTNEQLMDEFGISYRILLYTKKKYGLRNVIGGDADCHVVTGDISEDIVCEKIKKIGLPAKRMQFKDPYDIAIDKVRVDVKCGTKPWNPPSIKYKSSMYCFRVGTGKKVREKTDFYICLIMEQDFNEYFIIPSVDIPITQKVVSFAWPNLNEKKWTTRKIWSNYHNRWDLLFKKYAELTQV